MAEYISVADRQFLRVEEAGTRLRRIAALKRGLMRSLAGWLPRMPDFAGKCHLSRQLYLHARASQAAPATVVAMEAARAAQAARTARGQGRRSDDATPFANAG